MRVLNVAEKNDAAKNIAACLSNNRSQRFEGRSKFNKIYAFPYRAPQLGACEMRFTSVSGHLLSCDFSQEHRQWARCDPRALFNAPIETFVMQRFKPIAATLQEEARRAQTLVIWTDCDREGERIGFEVIEVCRRANARLRVFRARFSEITPVSVRNACDRLVEPDRKASESVECRQELDLRIGSSFTRLQTLQLRNRLASLRDQKVISYGPCQFPTLGFIVERYRAVSGIWIRLGVFFRVNPERRKVFYVYFKFRYRF